MTRYFDAYDLFVFDLDGTLADTREDLTASVNHALESLNVPPLGVETVTRFVGDGARTLMERAILAHGKEPCPTGGPDGLAGAGDAHPSHGTGASMGSESTEPKPSTALRDLDLALALFIDHYRIHSVEKTRLYPGVRETLEELAGARKKDLAVLTNKPTFHSVTILQRLEVLHLFRRVLGGDAVSAKKPDPMGLLSLLKELGHQPPRALLVGDSGVDLRTAQAAGIASAFVTYGFRPEARHETEPRHVLGSLRDLLGNMDS